MNILDALGKEEKGKVINVSGTTVTRYAMLGTTGILTWFDADDNVGLGGVSLTMINMDNWQPYSDEIRPEKPGELWVNERGGVWFVRYKEYYKIGGDETTILMTHADGETQPIEDMRYIIHGKNGWTREFPPVENEAR